MDVKGIGEHATVVPATDDQVADTLAADARATNTFATGTLVMVTFATGILATD